MTGLDTTSRFADPDAAFRLLVEAQRGLSADQSAELNARLVLILANHIGDAGVLAEAIALARGAGGAKQPGGNM
ncbi:MAG: DUF2783 domain-containing protein [Phreatobacter sp.]|uniref:DUF2783 domain-containing protein n=1 Tax=Phreatobacter sp. TaxID=1966341 RepID=UPI001A5126E6|nr:DUF2783 domain-containing protein [Phreatobacter sp.]MBL8568519.1 DUF2783 domain-containing protein [Phreatobacter sp.]